MREVSKLDINNIQVYTSKIISENSENSDGADITEFNMKLILFYKRGLL